MPHFKTGDHVERVGPLVPEYMKFGQIIRIIPHPDLPEHLTEYDVDFKSPGASTHSVGTFYEAQLRLVLGDPPIWS
jgi:hypothetical protein